MINSLAVTCLPAGGSENPFCLKLWFLLAKKSDRRKLFFWLEKPNCKQKGCNEQRDWLLINF
jgi:hypothetical protein